ncbi:carboxypeptidase-like regulatory domain-containing protein [Hyunsoonleella ulvae]|uniref:carboxypeptidase-like regulatory domain-containing protein n=1 Tax=Hyunsoonleella ulvae TaxID=2799948 RepID=UPI001939BD37|nr:carboxypeptidase-like regulatory domain-containing protein [Hyunsoonleella ulvae]
MDKNFSISISTPCSEQFSQFKKTATGGFCNSCKKEVIDFRQMSDAQIIDYLNNRQNGICGYFKSSQINRPMVHSTLKTRTFKFWNVAAIAILSLFSLQTIQAQEKIGKIKTETKVIVDNALLTGIVEDESGPLAGANILLKGSKIGGTADFDGKFKFPKPLQQGDILIVSYIGYEPQEVVIKQDQKFLKIKLTAADIDLLGEVQTSKVYSSKGR